MLDLFESATVGDTATIERLLVRDPSLLDGHSPDGWTVLHLAVHFGHVETAQAILGAGADVTARSDNALANQPLHAAAAGSSPVTTARLLLDHGADAAAEDGHWQTPAAVAADRGHHDVASLLAPGGA